MDPRDDGVRCIVCNATGDHAHRLACYRNAVAAAVAQARAQTARDIGDAMLRQVRRRGRVVSVVRLLDMMDAAGRGIRVVRGRRALGRVA